MWIAIVIIVSIVIGCFIDPKNIRKAITVLFPKKNRKWYHWPGLPFWPIVLVYLSLSVVAVRAIIFIALLLWYGVPDLVQEWWEGNPHSI